MADHKSESRAERQESAKNLSGNLADEGANPQFAPKTQRNGDASRDLPGWSSQEVDSPGASRPPLPPSVPPILRPRGVGRHAIRDDRMPAAGIDLIKSGFGLTALVLGIVGVSSAWISAWGMIPALLALLLGSVGLAARRRYWAALGMALGVASLGILLPRQFWFWF
jgi:hypothetical protein